MSAVEMLIRLSLADDAARTALNSEQKTALLIRILTIYLKSRLTG